MTKPIIEIKGLGKKYKIGALREPYLSLRDSLARKAKGFAQSISRLTASSSELRAQSSQEDFWALKDVNFSVQQGEAVGIIGRNGAGKSTLLKILSQITPPTEGEITCRGRIASLLEVGTGFHPELTGRENIYLNGAILGMTRGEIRSKFDEIVAFAEVEKFLDTPVKRYSSGMYVRLAFAVAAHLEPEILVVDEVLAVGDVQFQKKCLGKMKDVAGQGRTVLFVSHNMSAVRQLCNTGIILKSGRVVYGGNIENVIEQYLNSGNKNIYNSDGIFDIDLPSEKENIRGYVYKVQIQNEEGKNGSEVFIGSTWRIKINFRINEKTDHFIIALGLNSNLDFPLQTSWSVPQTLEPGEYEAVFLNDTIHLASGDYHLSIGMTTFNRHIQYVELAAILKISDLINTYENKHQLVKTSGCGFLLNQAKVVIKSTELSI